MKQHFLGNWARAIRSALRWDSLGSRRALLSMAAPAYICKLKPNGVQLRDWDSWNGKEGRMFAKVEVHFPKEKSQEERLCLIEQIVEVLSGDSTSVLPDYVNIIDRPSNPKVFGPITAVSLRLTAQDLIPDRSFLFVLCARVPRF